MWSSSFFSEQDPEEYIPLLLNRYDFENESDNTSEATTHNTDTDDSLSIISSHKNDNWLFSLINWDQIFENAASYLDINFTDYDYDRYATSHNNTLNNNNHNNNSSLDTFHYFLSSLSNGKINLNKYDIPPDNIYNMSIYEIIYDRVAKSRLYSLKNVFDQLYPTLNVSVNRIVAEIIRFELAPDTIRHLLYKSIINQYNKQCHPNIYKWFISISNWFIYIVFFAIHIMWLQFVWIDFLKHFNWENNGKQTDGEITDNADNPSENEPVIDASSHDLNAHVLSASLNFANATPLTVFDTIAKWTYFQWTTAVLFILCFIYMVVLYCIARRVDSFGDFLKKLQLTQLLKLGERTNTENNINISYGTVTNNTQIMLQYGTNINDDNTNNDKTTIDWGLDSDNDNNSIFSESDLNEETPWNYNDSSTSDEKMDVLSTKLVKQIKKIYYTREHLILYTVISLVKMLIILLYLSCLVMFFMIPSAKYWYLWTVMFDIFAFYVILKAINQICCSNNTSLAEDMNRIQSMRYVNDTGDIGILDCDGIFKHEWIVAMVNIVSVTGLLLISTLIISLYMSNYKQFVNQRLLYLQILAAVEIVWFASQFVLWKLNFYGTIFYLLLLIPSILFGSAAFYALYEYYILSLVHTFLAVLFACGEFHLVGPHDDDTTLDPADWSVLGVLALLAKLFKFRMPQQIY